MKIISLSLILIICWLLLANLMKSIDINIDIVNSENCHRCKLLGQRFAAIDRKPFHSKWLICSIPPPESRTELSSSPVNRLSPSTSSITNRSLMFRNSSNSNSIKRRKKKNYRQPHWRPCISAIAFDATNCWVQHESSCITVPASRNNCNSKRQPGHHASLRLTFANQKPNWLHQLGRMEPESNWTLFQWWSSIWWYKWPLHPIM